MGNIDLPQGQVPERYLWYISSNPISDEHKLLEKSYFFYNRTFYRFVSEPEYEDIERYDLRLYSIGTDEELKYKVMMNGGVK